MARQQRDATSDWISRQVATFGRYPQKRPVGLSVDKNGCFRLSALMSTWGGKQGVTKDVVVAALQKNRFHDRSVSLRFAMLHEPAGDMSISVHRARDGVTEAKLGPKCVKLDGDETATGADGGGQQPREPPWNSWNAKKPSLIGRLLRKGGSSAEPGADEQGDKRKEPDNEGGNAGWAYQRGNSKWPRSHWNQSSSSWPREGGGGGSSSWHTSSNSWGNKDDRWQNGGWKESEGSSSGGGSGSSLHARGEKVQKWLSYVLKSGHHELGIEVSDGWANLDELGEVLSAKRKDLGVADGKQLWELLRDTDEQGRFEIVDNRIRKLERTLRVPSTGAAARGSVGNGEAAAAPESESGERPPNPPGDHWVKYTDDGALWWFYDGPLGKWWKQEHDKNPVPWVDDDEEDGEAPDDEG